MVDKMYHYRMYLYEKFATSAWWPINRLNGLHFVPHLFGLFIVIFSRTLPRFFSSCYNRTLYVYSKWILFSILRKMLSPEKII